ncbi:TyrR/PhhR family helix-turn-helix DNA-binding protein [Catenovulum sediminis]|uniref:TyrR/PhhR family helix-turn-helix DNA-binding protein n=1 Tax=Catenovulum sediminis TaxID=1740262 RepID=A0ABV1REN2_9ALTE|nr:TyrR/PhhR family helix-turn-helix DNA-binding protein [Catenovulum sediminis]
MRLEISCENRIGITQDILEILVRHQIDLHGIEVHPLKIFLNFPKIEFTEFQHLMPEIRLLNGVQDVKTVACMPLERQEIELKSCLDNSSEMLVSLDEKGHLIRASRAALKLLSDFNREQLNTPSNWLKGVNLLRWLERKPTEKLLQVGEINEQTFQVEMSPIWLTPDFKEQDFVGVFIRLIESPSHYPLANEQQHLVSQIVHKSTGMRKVVREIKKFALSASNLALYGEAGTGKSWLASIVCSLSNHQLPSHKLDCRLNDSEVLRQEIEQLKSINGPLILERVDKLTMAAQKELHTALLMSPSKRVYVTSQQSLLSLVQQGLFDENLQLLLGQLEIPVPPLRERKADFVDLTARLLNILCRKLQRVPVDVTQSCMEKLSKYAWPGNVKQLNNTLEQALLLQDSNTLKDDDVNLSALEKDYLQLQTELEGSLDDAVKRFENALLRKLYPHYPSTRQLAQKLGLSHTAIANKLREYGINKSTVKVIKG